MWKLRGSISHVSSSSLNQIPLCSNQQNQTKPEPHQPGVTLQIKQKAKKEMPRNQKAKGINVKRDFPVQLDLRPGKVNASSLVLVLI